MKALIIGDIHGRFHAAGEWIRNVLQTHHPQKVDCIIQVGDFGFFPKLHGMNESPQWDFNVPVYWIDGNHDDHEILQSDDPGMALYSSEADPDVINDWSSWLPDYKSRGTIENGILFLGGASSIDKAQRTPGVDWFHREDISFGDQMMVMENVQEYGPENIHTVISHDAPSSFNVAKGCSHKEVKDESNRSFLEHVLREADPDKWFFGHYHASMEGHVGHVSDTGTDWRCLDMIYYEMDKNDYEIVTL